MKIKIKKDDAIIICLLLLGCCLRLIGTTHVPGGLNQDEAFAGYNAYSLLTYGVDSFEYHNPVYFVAWGSGMNVLESYLMIPFIKLFGLHEWVIRLPQGILASCALWVFYLLVKKIYGDKKVAILGLFILTICPWHIMLARWGLESNLAPELLLFGFYFFIMALDNDKYFYPMAISYGLCLYSYATVWPIIPVLLILQIAYCLMAKKLKLDNVNLWGSMAILFVFAIPLILFMLVNYGIMGEIRTQYFSIPKLIYFRNGEISFSGISNNFVNLLKIIILQSDGRMQNVSAVGGMFYHFSLVFMLIGFGRLCVNIIRCIRNNKYSVWVLIAIELVLFFILGTLINVNVNRINGIWFWILILIIDGIYALMRLKSVLPYRMVLFLYAISFVAFISFYTVTYPKTVSEDFMVGFGEAIEYAKEQNNTIYIDTGIVFFPNILFYDKTSPYEFIKSVQWAVYPAKFLSPTRFGNYYIEPVNPDNLHDYTYILSAEHEDVIDKNRNEIVRFNNYIVVFKR